MIDRSNRRMERAGGIASLYLAASLIAAMVFFLLIARIPEGASAGERLAALAATWVGQYVMTLASYVVFGLALVVLAVALHGRIMSGAEQLMKAATPIALIWAGLLIASGMIFNVGLQSCMSLMASDPARAAVLWQSTELVSAGLSGNGEIVGGSWMLLASLSALRSKRLPLALNVIGLVVAVVGLSSVVPALKGLAAAFGLGQIVWCSWLGIVLLRGSREANA